LIIAQDRPHARATRARRRTSNLRVPMSDESSNDPARLPELGLCERTPSPLDTKRLTPQHAPPSPDTTMPTRRQLLALSCVLRGVGNDAAMAVHTLDVRPRSQVPLITRPNHLVPRARQPLFSHERYTNDDEVVVRRAPGLRLQLPDHASPGKPVAYPHREHVQVPLPALPISWPLTRVGKRCEQHPAAHMRYGHGAQRLLQARPTAPREFAHLAAERHSRPPLRAGIPTAQLGTRPTPSGRNTRAVRLDQIWTVDKPNARFGARLADEQRQRQLDTVIADRCTLTPSLGQVPNSCPPKIRGPPSGTGGPPLLWRPNICTTPPHSTTFFTDS